MVDRAKSLELQIRNPSHLSWNHHSHSHSHSYTHTVAIIIQASGGLVAKERKIKQPKVAKHWVVFFMKSVLQSTLLAACKKPRTRHVLLSASEHASANIELASRRKRTIWILAINAC